ncbi:MAG: TonB-dependent receptor [Aestuariivirga sp.]|uniref:TonB-dependent receptor n=1 Tax=Aestuariivirga sp. TaxID=2650926 RepID=UPI0025C4B8C4|nr:TonB-dependent receptor [Aestuariivirga sp.]MCA3561251.1 TonB-dependent receptor [Aestuariivirga sp.]
MRAGRLALVSALLLCGTALARAGEAGDALFSISVDGQHVAGTPGTPDNNRKTDLALEQADIQVKYDGLNAKPMLNAATTSSRRSFAVGEEVEILASSNYPAYIARQEIRIFATGKHAPAAPIAVVKVGKDNVARWTMPEAPATQGFDDFVYVLRVYDAKGRFDETRPLTLVRRSSLDTAPAEEGPAAPGFSGDNTSFRNIRVDGGAVTVAGRNVPAGATVDVLGEQIPVDGDGRFVVQRILPVGEHDVDVALKGEKDGSLTFDRSINIPSSEWFYVGLADLTLGSKTGSKHIEDVAPGEYDGVYDKGRAAFYLKGKIKGSWLLTAAADTGDGSVENMLTGLDERNPQSFLKRINPEDYYPVYGDESVAIEDAPTSGKFYVRVERGDSRVVWGNFKTDIRGTEFLRNDRALYGANVVLKTDRMAPSGERSGELHGYAAQPGTLPQRDVFRGTGGSAYFLTHQDITTGSETLYIEVRNPVTGRVVDRKTLVFGRDYSINYVQGVVLLNEPLSSSTDNGNLVRDGAIGGNQQYLVAAYEYVPTAGDVDGYVYGGRAQQWVGDHVRLGVTGALENTGAADQKLGGADIQFYKSEQTFLEGEVAVSEGPGFGFSESLNGGLTVTEPGIAGSAGDTAMAYRVLGRLDPGEVIPGAKGDLQASFAYKQSGFSTLDEQVTEDRYEYGIKGDLELSKRLTFNFYGDRLESGGDVTQNQGGADLTYMMKEDLSVSLGVQQLDVNNPENDVDGTRTDTALKLTRILSDTSSVYVFGQATLARTGNVDLNNRGGVGGTRQFTDTIDGSAEISYGDGGIGGRALLSYQPVASDRYYIGYALDPGNYVANDLLSGKQNDDLGGIVAGVRHGFSERLSVYAENKYNFWSDQPSLTQVYGVTYTPTPEWKLGGAIESGKVWGNTADLGFDNNNFNRNAVSATAVYNPNDKMTASVKGEVRFDDGNSADGGDQTAYYLAARYSNALSENWRVLAALDAVVSDATDSSIGGNYVQASVGYAYRPVLNDRLNALAKYVYVYDVPGPDQVNIDGQTGGPSQQSHIFSVDATYDLTQMVSIGGKYGLRIGEWKQEDGSGWENSTAQLGVIRADLHVVKKWDVMLEGRCLWENASQSANWGAVAALYRQINDNFDVGVGYNFGRYSDDLADLSANDQGFFVNAIGKL